MSQEAEDLEQILRTRVTHLNATIYGLVLGFTLGAIIFVATVWLVIKGGPVVGPNLSLLSEFYIGYSVTWLGSIIGFLYGFFTGYLLGYFIARVYNWILSHRDGR